MHSKNCMRGMDRQTVCKTKSKGSRGLHKDTQCRHQATLKSWHMRSSRVASMRCGEKQQLAYAVLVLPKAVGTHWLEQTWCSNPPCPDKVCWTASNPQVNRIGMAGHAWARRVRLAVIHNETSHTHTHTPHAVGHAGEASVSP